MDMICQQQHVELNLTYMRKKTENYKAREIEGNNKNYFTSQNIKMWVTRSSSCTFNHCMKGKRNSIEMKVMKITRLLLL